MIETALSPVCPSFLGNGPQDGHSHTKGRNPMENIDFLQLVRDRYSVRKFQEQPVSQEDLEKILLAGQLAPTGCNNQPFRVLVIQSGEALEKLRSCTRCHFDAPTVLLVCSHSTECWKRPYDGKLSGDIDASIVTTHMMLEAASLGVGSCWVMHFNPSKLREAFAIPPELEPVALLPMGYPAPDAAPLPLHSQTRSLEELVCFDHF